MASSDLQRLADRYADETGGRAVIVDASGGLVADSAPPAGVTGQDQRSFASRPEIAKALRGQESTGSRHSDTLRTDLLYVAVPVASGGEVHGAVRVTYPLSFVSDRVRRNWLLLAGIGGVVLAVVFVVSLWLARSVTRPLADLERAAWTARWRRPRSPRTRSGRPERGAAARGGVQRDRIAARGARGRAAGVRRGCLAPAADPACRAAAAAREPRGRGRRSPPPTTSRARVPRCTVSPDSSTAFLLLREPNKPSRHSPTSTSAPWWPTDATRGRHSPTSATCGSKLQIEPGLSRSSDAGTARAGARQPAQQRARGRARVAPLSRSRRDRDRDHVGDASRRRRSRDER